MRPRPRNLSAGVAIGLAAAVLWSVTPTTAAGPAYVPDKLAVRPYEAPPPPEDLDRLEVRELDDRVAALEARMARLQAIWAARQSSAGGKDQQ